MIPKKITGIIIAGGKSRRMGREKGLVIFKKKPLIEYSINVLKESCSSILISTNNDEYLKYNYPIIKDVIPDIGPIGGLYSALKQSKTPYNLILPCDMPNITFDAIQHLVSGCWNEKYVVAEYNTRIEPLFSIVHRNLLDDIEKSIQEGEYKLMLLLKRVHAKRIDFSEIIEHVPNLFTNYNTPESLI